jgi:hypothetical protein
MIRQVFEEEIMSHTWNSKLIETEKCEIGEKHGQEHAHNYL